MENKDKKHKRRIRYKGTHPKSYKDKYKELQPEIYPETIERVMQKGSTPAGMHRPILVDEILDFLQVKPNQVGLDATLGYGGHTLEILKCMDFKGQLYATDVDPIELPKTQKRLEALGYGSSILKIRHMNFSNIDKIVEESGPLDFILADLGVSSMQIDNPERGFTFKTDGPLDLRLNPSKGRPASEKLPLFTIDELEGMLIENADEPYAREIAKAITSYIKSGKKIGTSSTLQEIIGKALNFIPANKRDLEIKKSAQRTFQALRIDINDELEVLYYFLEKIPSSLKKGGKVAILSFHSGEDRLVKKSFQHYLREGIYSEIVKGPIRPSSEEINSNPRARSAKLRWAIKG